MVDAHWTLKSTKRKITPPSAPTSSKRHQLETVSSSGLRRQQTLTQAQWIANSPISFEDADDLQPILTTPGPAGQRKRSKKRDSTLTQMDFFSTTDSSLGAIDTGVLQEKPTEGQDEVRVSQTDGTYDSPRKSRRTKSKGDLATVDRSSERMTEPPTSTATDTHGGSTRRKRRKMNEDYASSETTGKRSSKRLAAKAKVLSDPVDNFDNFTSVLSPPVIAIPDSAAPPASSIEIGDSDEVEHNTAFLPTNDQVHQGIANPQTPRKRKPIVFSSQSPESLPPTTIKRIFDIYSPQKSRRRTPSVSRPSTVANAIAHSPHFPRRTPLAPLSTNVTPRTPLARAQIKGGKVSSKRNPAKSKIVTLKIPLQQDPHNKPVQPNTPEHMLSSGAYLKESRFVTSPPTRRTATLAVAETLSSEAAGVPLSKPTSRGLHNNPATSSPEIPNSTASIGLSLHSSQAATTGDHEIDGAQFGIMTRSSSSNQLEGIVPVKGVEDSDSVWGSPIANDTQFDIDVQHRTSSPRSNREITSTQLPGSKSPGCILAASQRLRGTRDHDEADARDGDTFRSPLPVPRLVSPRMHQGTRPQDTQADHGDSLPQLPAYINSSCLSRTAKVPLNDLPSSSSSVIPSSTGSKYRRPVHPASIPHPSQISTQEATQAYFGMSSMITPSQLLGQQSNNDSISIKDSSSQHIPLSQIPNHKRSQSQVGVNNKLTQWQDEDENEFDLDPSSEAPAPAEEQHHHDTEITPKAVLAAPVPIPQIQLTLTEQDQLAEHDKVDSATVTEEPAKDDDDDDDNQSTPSSQISTSSKITVSPPPRLQREYTPISGFNNETQSNFTQHGHVTAAYIHRQREAGVIPKWYTPEPYQVPGYRRK